MSCDTRERPDGMESCADGINDLQLSLKQTPISAHNKERRSNEGRLESDESNHSTGKANTADEVSENMNMEVERQLFEEERKRRINSKNETVNMLQCNRQQSDPDQRLAVGTERVDSGQLAATITSTDLPIDQRSRVPREQSERSLPPCTTKEGQDELSLASLTWMPIEESERSLPHTTKEGQDVEPMPVEESARGPASQLVPSGVQHQDKFLSLPEEKPADTLVKCIITDNALLMDSMCQHLDRESRIVKCWRHLAYVLQVPTEVSRTFDLYTERSPTEDLFQYLQTFKPQLTVKQLKDLLKKDYRNDLVEKLANFNNGEAVCDLVGRHPHVLTALASELDMDSRTIGSWRSLAAKCGVTRNKVDQFGMPKHGPTDLLFYYLEKQGSSLTVGQLKGHLKKMQRNDVLLLFEKHKGFSDDCLVKVVLKQDSELLCEVGHKLNKEIRALEGWRNLAYRLKIPSVTYNTFDVSKEKKSPTRLLFEWLRTGRAHLTIDELLQAVREIKRNDVVEMIRKETESAVKKGFAIPEYRTTSQVYDTLTKMKDETSGKCSEDLLHKLKVNAWQKRYQLQCNNPGNGNCMFHALSDQALRLNYDHIEPERMRENLVQYLEENPKLADGTELVQFVVGYERWSDYLKEMRKAGTWGDNIMLLAAANHFKRPIRVISSLPHNTVIVIMPVQMPDPHVVNNPMVLGHIAEYHYVSLEPVQENGQEIPVHIPGAHSTGAERQLPGVNPHKTTEAQIMTLGREQKLQMRPTRLPFHIYGKMCRVMDTKRDFFDDFRMLAEELGIDRDDIRWLEQQHNPTEKILIQKENTLTVGGFIQLLHKIGREDVASMLEKWVESES